MRNYYLHLEKIKSAYKDILNVYDVKLSVDTSRIGEEIKNLLEIRPRERLAYKPPSIAVLGPPCSGKNQVVE